MDHNGHSGEEIAIVHAEAPGNAKGTTGTVAGCEASQGREGRPHILTAMTQNSFRNFFL